MILRPVTKKQYNSHSLTLYSNTDANTPEFNQQNDHIDQTNSRIKNMKKSKRRLLSASSRNSTICFDDNNSKLNPEKIFVSRIRKQRFSLQDQVKTAENTFFFCMKKLEKDRKRRTIESVNQTKRSRILLQSSRQKLIFQKEIKKNETKQLKEKRNIRQRVIDQRIKRMNSQRSLVEEHIMAADQLRQQKKKHKQRQLEFEAEFYRQKNQKFKMGKEQQRRRILGKKQLIERKMTQAKNNYRNKWMHQYYKTQNFKSQARKKLTIINEKIFEIMQTGKQQERIYSKMYSSQRMFF